MLRSVGRKPLRTIFLQ